MRAFFVATLLILIVAADPVAAQFDNVLFITVDTLRADHLSSYGYHLKTSPVMDQLASEGVRFHDAYTVAPRTGPSHISMFTSRYPQEHGVKLNGFAPPSDLKLLFLPQIMRKFGYRTGAFVSSWVLTSGITNLKRWFDDWDQELTRSYQLINSMRHAEDVTPAAMDWLRKQDGRKPFFLWVHYFDPHLPHDVHPGFESPEQIGEPAPGLRGLNETIQNRIRRYNAEILYTDHWVGKLLKTIDELGLRDETLVVLVSDHGESLGENDYLGHGRMLYERIVRVPLIMRYPGKIPAGAVVSDRVSLLDLAPTILDLTVKANAEEDVMDTFRGASLAPSWTDSERWEPRETVRYVTWSGQKWYMPKWFSRLWLGSLEMPLRVGYTQGDRKIIWKPGEREIQLTDLEAHPLDLEQETFGPNEKLYGREVARLRRWYESTHTAGNAESRMSEEDVRALKSLGYLQ